MIKFFRKIRQNLISEGKTLSYLKYAIGEIVLVMIGILLALQVNNWNENRKDNIREVTNLKNLKSELEISLEELKSDYNSTKIFHNSALKIQNWIRKKTPISDSMYRDFFLSYQFTHFFPKTSTYETFKNGNLELIQSDSLKILITDIYEAGYKRILLKTNTPKNTAMHLFYQDNFRITSDVKSRANDNLAEIKYSYKAIPNDYESLIKNPKYESIISEAIMDRKIQIRDFEFTLGLVQKGINQIDAYLKTK
ncbi:DUF6090 family protein [Gaetbulibacter sp. M240]|uniref:DUF6090 family protein n=1 Tax=Gaetbulibacter sp. M240 TaxID=3126511 RepID=UPI00374F16C2